MNEKSPNREIKIGFIGCGNMARAIITGLINRQIKPTSIMASNRSHQKLEEITQLLKIQTSANNNEVVKFADVVILAVKPQILPTVCQQLMENTNDLDLANKLFISIAAGISTAKIASLLSANSSIIRAMPNTPATIGSGATGLFANSKTSKQQKEIAERIFESVGTVEWINDESHMDIVTAIAGSSPAYVFYFMQSIIEQAVESGLDSKTATNLVFQSMLGSVNLAISKPSETLATLRNNVTSPGGTTAAAIKSFDENHFSNIIKTAITAAILRGKELGEKN